MRVYTVIYAFSLSIHWSVNSDNQIGTDGAKDMGEKISMFKKLTTLTLNLG